KEIREFCEQNKIIYESFWSLSANPHILNNEILINLSQKYQRSEEVVFYRFLNQINITPLNGTTSKKHMIEDLAFCEFELTNIEIKQINNLLV
nr:aldo/keto reductase [Aliarcobacter sp.]MBP7226685.1 aldo/keto reductase [Aliarcobacter sp.]